MKTNMNISLFRLGTNNTVNIIMKESLGIIYTAYDG